MPAGLTRKSDAAHKKSAKRQSGGVYAYVIVRGGIPDHAFYSRDPNIVRQGKRKVKAVQKMPLGAIIERSTTHRRVQ